jgi:hypothetical protein
LILDPAFMSRHEPRPIIFAPDFLGIALFHPAGLRILNLWRDGQLQPVVNRPLLLSYFRVFRTLGLPDLLVRRWAWWLVSPPQSRFLAEPSEPAGSSTMALCGVLARKTGAGWIVHSGTVYHPENLDPGTVGEAPWILPNELLPRLEMP